MATSSRTRIHNKTTAVEMLNFILQSAVTTLNDFSHTYILSMVTFCFINVVSICMVPVGTVELLSLGLQDVCYA